MKWKAIFTQRKPVFYTISSVTGNNYIFGFVNASASYNEDDREYDGIEYAFSKIKITQEEVDKEVKKFLKNLGETFWLDLGNFKDKIKWTPGPIWSYDFVDGTGYIERTIDLSDRHATFNLNYIELTLTDVIGLYHEFNNLDDLAMVPLNFVRTSLKVVIYQYVWATNWRLRKQLLEVLMDDPINLSYDDMEKCFIWIEKMDWKIPC